MIKAILLSVFLAQASPSPSPLPTVPPTWNPDVGVNERVLRDFISSIYGHLCDNHQGFVVTPHIAIGWKFPGQAFPVIIQCQDGLVTTITAPTPVP